MSSLNLMMKVQITMKNSKKIILEKFITDYCNISRVVPKNLINENQALLVIYNILILKSLKNIHGTKEYHDFLHENYGASFIYRSSIVGDYIYMGPRIECISKEYLPSRYDAFSKLIEETKIALFEDPVFDDSLIENNKRELEEYIKQAEKSPYKVCFLKAFRQIDKDHRFNENTTGTIEDVKKVNKAELIKLHNKIKKCPISIIYQGNNKFNQFENVKSVFNDDFELPEFNNIPLRNKEFVYGEEEFDNPHSFIISVYIIDFEFSIRENYVFRILVTIIGGNNSILFDEIREKKGVCYSIYATPFSSEKVFNITTQVSRKKIDETLSSIDVIMNDLDSYLTTKRFEIAKMDLITQLIDISDDAIQLFNNNIVSLYKRNREFDYEKSIEIINSITYQDVIKLSKSIKKISTYVVKGKE